GRALDLDRPAVARHDAPRDGQAQARAARTFGREERLEHASTHVLDHADARIAHGDDRPLRFGGQPHGAAPAVRHRIDRVRDEIRENLAQLLRPTCHGRGDALDRELVARAAALRLDLPARARELDHLAGDVAQVDALERTGAAGPRELLDASYSIGAVLRG